MTTIRLISKSCCGPRSDERGYGQHCNYVRKAWTPGFQDFFDFDPDPDPDFDFDIYLNP